MNHTEIATTTEPAKRFQCRHIFTDGRRCGSPCLRHEEFCYYHHTTRRPVQPSDLKTRHRCRGSFDLPNPSDLADRSGIQLAIGQVLQRIAANDLDPRRAGLLLYGLQIASLNLPKDQPKSEPLQTVEEITVDPVLGALAPRAELHEQTHKGIIQTLLEDLERQEEEEQAAHNAQSTQPPVDTPESLVLPAILAVAALEPEHWARYGAAIAFCASTLACRSEAAASAVG
jgi:hypothetical protein